jgi:methionyl-tRNA formyltransferase
VGRKQVLTPPQIKVRALAAGLAVLQPLKIRHAVEELKAFNADVAVVIAYGQILSRAVLDVPPLGCLNVHTSLLPRHRGAAPIQAAIRDGDTETGVTIMFMDEGLDTGDILLMHRVAIACDETGGSLHDRLAQQAPAALEEALDLLATGNPPREKQDESKVTHVRKLTRQDGRLDWTRPAIELDRLVRAFTPWPGTSCMLKEAQMKIHRAQAIANAEVCPAPGTIVSANADGILVSCGNGLLNLSEVQIEGGRRLSAADFLRGHPLHAGDVLH